MRSTPKTKKKVKVRPNAQKFRLNEDERFSPPSDHPYIAPDLRFEDVPVLLSASRAGFHFVDTRLVVYLTDWGKRKTQERLAYLVKNEYLQRVRRPVFGKSGVDSGDIFRTTLKGCSVLRVLYGLSKASFSSAYGLRLPRYDQIDHILDLGRFRAIVDKSSNASGGHLITSIDDRGLRSYFAVNETELALIPDGYVKVKLSTGDTSHLFLEMDRGRSRTPAQKRWYRRFDRYASFWSSGEFVRSFDLANPHAEFRVIVATLDQTRALSLARQATRRIGVYAQLFYFAPIATLVANNLFIDSVWCRGDGQQNKTLYPFSNIL